MTTAELKLCNHDPIKMCDPCCVCSRLEVKFLKDCLIKLRDAKCNSPLELSILIGTVTKEALSKKTGER